MAKRKSARGKTPKAVVSPVASKTPRVASPPPAFKGGSLSWRFNAVDRNGEFSWGKLEDPEIYKTVIEALATKETMSEADLQQGGSHFIDVGNLSAEAKARLVELQLDDIDEVYSIRITGAQRVFCIHRATYMRVLWWDPEHKVCPSKKKHT